MLQLRMFIDGVWKDAASGRVKDVLNPANGETIAKVADGGLEDAKQAIEAARKSFDGGAWSELGGSERAAFLFRIADAIDRGAEELARLESLDNGKTFREAVYDVASTAECFRYYAGLITKPEGHTLNVPGEVQTIVVREPIGVCALIAPWNYPLLMGAWKIAPALAAGNSIVYKPAQVTPLTAVKLFEIIEAAGVPAGVANLVLGPGSAIGNELAESPLVDSISFTGGTDTGRSVMRAAAGNLKKISLELGGKSPNIVFADADFETAVDYALYAIYMGSGQVCSAGSRLLVEDAIYDRFVERFAERAKRIRVGPGDRPETEMGPLVSKAHMENVLRYVEIGKQEGARLVCGGYRLEGGIYDAGNFVAPTAFADVESTMRIVKEEIFGPVVVIQKFSGEQEAIRLANDSEYGLAGAVFTQDGAKALRVIKKVRSGITYVNTYHQGFVEAPWGGYKQSGIGRELSTFGMDEYQEVKQININLQVEPIGWFDQ